MMNSPERSPERDAAIDAIVARVPTQGWTMSALRGALADIGANADDATLLFPGGAVDMIEAFIDLADRRMSAAAEAAGIATLRLPERVRAVIAARLRQHAGHKDAIRRAFAILALPRNAIVAARCTARTVDEIWYIAGDRSADITWYTKRAILTAVYSATLLFWLRDYAEDDNATLAFLDRRLAGVARVTRLRRRIEDRLSRISFCRSLTA